MRHATSPPLRWLRRAVAFAPLVVLTVCPAAVFVVHPQLIGVLTVPPCLLALLVGVWVARMEVRTDRHVTPAMAARYHALARLLDHAQDREVRIDATNRFSILLLDEHLTDRTVQRTLLRFDQDELENAGHDGVATPVVFDHFVLDLRRPLVRHRLDAVVITRETDGRARIAELTRPVRDKRATAETARLLTTTAIEIPPITDLDLLLEQIRSAAAVTP